MGIVFLSNMVELALSVFACFAVRGSNTGFGHAAAFASGNVSGAFLSPDAGDVVAVMSTADLKGANWRSGPRSLADTINVVLAADTYENLRTERGPDVRPVESACKETGSRERENTIAGRLSEA